MSQEGLELVIAEKEALSRFESITITHPQTYRMDSKYLNLPTNLHFLALPNKGRDVWPFKKSIRHVLPQPEDILLKWHDKKRNQFSGKQLNLEERRNLLKFVLQPSRKSQSNFEDAIIKEVTGVAPAGWLLPLSFRLGNNERKLKDFCNREGWEWSQVLERSWFPAGMIFAIKADVVLRSEWYSDELTDVEYGHGGLDGTWAHASERWIGCLNSFYGNWAEAR